MNKNSGQLTPEITKNIVDLALSGKTTREISKWLLKEKSIKISHVTISHVLKDDHFRVSKVVRKQKKTNEIFENKAEIIETQVQELITVADSPKLITNKKQLFDLCLERLGKLGLRSEELWNEHKTIASYLPNYIKMVQLEQKETQIALAMMGVDIDNVKDNYESVAREFDEKLKKAKLITTTN